MFLTPCGTQLHLCGIPQWCRLRPFAGRKSFQYPLLTLGSPLGVFGPLNGRLSQKYRRNRVGISLQPDHARREAILPIALSPAPNNGTTKSEISPMKFAVCSDAPAALATWVNNFAVKVRSPLIVA